MKIKNGLIEIIIGFGPMLCYQLTGEPWAAVTLIVGSSAILIGAVVACIVNHKRLPPDARVPQLDCVLTPFSTLAVKIPERKAAWASMMM